MKSNQTTNERLLWVTDLHFDQIEEDKRNNLLNCINNEKFISCVVSGDIGTSENLSDHIADLTKACGSKRNVYLLLGNHDFYGSSIKKTNEMVADLSCKIKNLHHLHGNGPIELKRGIFLIGHHGWADGQAGCGSRSEVRNPDHWCIDDFRQIARNERFPLMKKLGRESTNAIRRDLFLCHKKARKILIATHAPAFASSTIYNGNQCGQWHLPHFVNYSLGGLLISAARSKPERSYVILSGHTHSYKKDTVLTNLESYVGSPCEMQFIDI